MQLRDRYSTWVEVDVKALEDNVRYYVENTGSQVMAVVKANGYGHGAVQAAKAALHGGANWCGVARVEEALELRQAGVECPILLMGLTPIENLRDMIAARVSMTVWERNQVAAAAIAAQQIGEQAHLHLKVDTGMSRLGVQVDEAPALAHCLADTQGVLFEGLFTHFARADERDSTTTDVQAQLFCQVLEQLEAGGLRPPFVHAANSAAALTRPNNHFDLVRVGISIYGLHPSREFPLPPEFRPALVWKTQLSQVKMLAEGRGLSYGHIYTTSGTERIGTLPVGYADGFRRIQGNQVLVGSRRVPVVGRVCMDQCMVQLDTVPDVRPGDEVVLIGSQGEERISAEEVAECWGTINYEVTCGITSRVPRLYLDRQRS